MAHNGVTGAELADEFGRTAKILARVLDERLSKFSRSTPRARVLAVIASSPGARLADVMAQVGVGQATASALVDGLVSEGLVERRQDEADRRASVLTVTTDGAASAEEWAEAYRLVAEDLFASLGHRDRRTLVRLLRLLARDAEGVPGRRGGVPG
jgi:DNA-binding MarR family transcriptional regulator